MNLWIELKSRFANNIEKTAIISSNNNIITYGEILKDIENISKNILEINKSNNRIAILNCNPYSDAICVLSTLAADCIVVPMSMNYGEDNCLNIIKNIKPSVIITDMETLSDKIMNVAKLSKTKIIELKDLYRENKKFFNINYSTEIAMIMSTSGTTGVPKGVVLTHLNILSNLSDISCYFILNSNDKILIIRPLYHAAVMTGEFLHGLMSGCTVIFYNEPFSPRRLLSFIDKIKCTVMCATPSIFYNIAMSKRKINLDNLRLIAVSGECLNLKIADILIKSFPEAQIFNVYGLTEASPRVTYLDSKFFRIKIGSVGIPLKSIRIKIVDKDGNMVNMGEIGELIVQGPNVMQCYWNNAEETERKIKNDWLYTGDLAYIDEDGYIYIMGRKDYMIIRAGMNIYPQEIENAILTSEKFKEVVAWGEEDIRCGQSISVAVVPLDCQHTNIELVMNICRQKLQPYQWPEKVYIKETLPKNGSGKLIRSGRVIVMHEIDEN